jgi:hypothetical protein
VGTMSLLIYAKEDDKTRQIDLEDLFTKEKVRSQKMVSTFNKILNRIHKRIELTGTLINNLFRNYFNKL